MRRYPLFFLLLLLSLQCHTAFAYRKHSIYIGDGIGSSEQFRNVSGDYTRQGMPLTLTGPVFATYRYSFSKLFSAGVTAGIDNTAGRITKTRKFYYDSPLPSGTLGAYKRRSATIAGEVLIRYGANEDGGFYSALGAGFTFSKVTLTYRTDVYDEFSKKDPKLLASANPTRVNDNRIAHQVTLLGYRTDDPLAVFVELGFGYKGLLHLGLSYEF